MAPAALRTSCQRNVRAEDRQFGNAVWAQGRKLGRRMYDKAYLDY